MGDERERGACLRRNAPLRDAEVKGPMPPPRRLQPHHLLWEGLVWEDTVRIHDRHSTKSCPAEVAAVAYGPPPTGKWTHHRCGQNARNDPSRARGGHSPRESGRGMLQRGEHLPLLPQESPMPEHTPHKGTRAL